MDEVYEQTEVLNGDELHKMAVKHWDYVKGLIYNSNSNIDHRIVESVIAFHYITAFKHGYKHGMEDKK